MLRRPATVRARALPAAVILASLLAGLLPGTAVGAIAARQMTDGSGASAPTSTTIDLEPVASGLDRPVLVVSPRDGTGRLFIVEQTGRIRVLKDGTVLPQPLLDLGASISTGGEQGLLGLAFHPSFATNRRFYVNYTNPSGSTTIREYRTSATSPDRTEYHSGRTILRIAQPYSNHNGGMIAFGPGGYLYIGTGDGGSSGDPGNRAQSLNSLLGKILRIDVNGTTSTRSYRIPSTNPYVGRTGLDEIWQRGLRNPWRFSFDRTAGYLWIADVGQGRYEEIDRAANNASGPGRGVNWGWRVMEGFHCHNPSSGCSRTGKKAPLVEYAHASGRCSVTGGYVYRGSAIPALAGYYVFGDFCSGEIWAVAAGTAAGTTSAPTILLLDTDASISGFGEDQSGELYVVDLAGTVSRIVPG
jgi:glucose/arabinose dehydrogenase